MITPRSFTAQDPTVERVPPKRKPVCGKDLSFPLAAGRHGLRGAAPERGVDRLKDVAHR
jgi:hypothetical protein